jgi:hypothetical protein
MRIELLQLIYVRVEEACHSLREEVATLKLLLARVGDSLESSKACTSDGPGLTPCRLHFRMTPLSKSLLWLRKTTYMVVSLLVVVLAYRPSQLCRLPLRARVQMGSLLR